MDKLRKALLLMLLSPTPGEVMAARAAVMRLAQSQKLDGHKLADTFIIALLRGRRPNGSDELSVNERAARCWDWHQRTGRLSERELGFVEDMMNARFALSEKQQKWLNAIFARVR